MSEQNDPGMNAGHDENDDANSDTAGAAGGSNNVTENDGSIQHISIKPPQFSQNFCNGWFEILEAQFVLARVQGTQTKFYNALSSLPADIVCKVPSEILSSKNYESLKKAVKDAFLQSKAEIFERLTAKTPVLGKPSQFLRDLRDQAGRVDVGDDLVRHRFLQAMPEAMRPVLAAQQSMSLTDLGKLADDLLPLSGSINVSTGREREPSRERSHVREREQIPHQQQNSNCMNVLMQVMQY